eukprot:1198567-Ditylum_brightwellii.AAC.2
MPPPEERERERRGQSYNSGQLGPHCGGMVHSGQLALHWGGMVPPPLKREREKKKRAEPQTLGN